MIEDLLDHIGIENLRRLGEEVQGRCPLHEKRTGERERRPDHWSINRRTGAHHCFSCEYSGSLTRLIIDVTGAGIWEATQMIRRFDVEIGSHHQEEAWEPPITTVVESRLEDFGPAPPRALERRHLTPESVSRYGIRWDEEESAWVIPIFSPTGEKWGWQAKSVDGIRNRPSGIKKGLTLFGFHLLCANTAVLVESPLDVVYLDTLGVPAVAAYGCQVSERQMKLLIERLDALVVALDNDKAGVRETRRLLEEKWHHRIPLSVFNYKGMEGKDPGELSPPEVTRGLETAVLASFW
jgi:DNA primase